MYSKGAKREALKASIANPPSPSFQLHLNSHCTGDPSAITPTPVLPPNTPTYDPFSFTSNTNGIPSVATSSPMEASFARSPVDQDTDLLDPQLLALQPSPRHMLPTHFTTTDHLTIQLPSAAMDQSPESVSGSGPSPFASNDFTFFNELNHILGILNPTDDMQTQLDQLMSSVAPSSAAPTWHSTPNVNKINVRGYREFFFCSVISNSYSKRTSYERCTFRSPSKSDFREEIR